MHLTSLYILSPLLILPLCSTAPLTTQRGRDLQSTSTRKSSDARGNLQRASWARVISSDKPPIAPSAFPNVAPEILPEMTEASKRASIPHDGTYFWPLAVS
jgi:hypothetical protein